MKAPVFDPKSKGEWVEVLFLARPSAPASSLQPLGLGPHHPGLRGCGRGDVGAAAAHPLRGIIRRRIG